MISTPAISSPWTAALSHTVRPSRRPWKTWTGSEMRVPVTSRAIGISPVAERPGSTWISPILKGGRFTSVALSCARPVHRSDVSGRAAAEVGDARVHEEPVPDCLASDEHPESHLVACRVRVTSASTVMPASRIDVRTTGRWSTLPDELLMSRVETTGASATTESDVDRCQGWTSKRIHGAPPSSEPLEVEGVQRGGASAGVDLGLEVRDLPVGEARTHSRQPSTGRFDRRVDTVGTVHWAPARRPAQTVRFVEVAANVSDVTSKVLGADVDPVAEPGTLGP